MCCSANRSATAAAANRAILIAGPRLPTVAGTQRLLSIYGGNDSFNRYATRLLGLLDVLTPTESSVLPPLTRDDRWQPPPSLLVQLGTFASGGRPIPAEGVGLGLVPP